MSRTGIAWFAAAGVFAIARRLVEFADVQYFAGLATYEFGDCDSNAEVVLIEIADAGHGSGFPPEVWQIHTDFFRKVG